MREQLKSISQESSFVGWGLFPSFAALIGASTGVFGVIILTTAFAAENFHREVLLAALALGISLVAGVSGLIMIHGSRGTPWEMWSPIMATVLRMGLTLLFLAGFLVMQQGLVTIRFLLYLIVFYVVILAFETFLSLYHLNCNLAAARKTGKPRACDVSSRPRQAGDLEVSSQGED